MSPPYTLDHAGMRCRLRGSPEAAFAPMVLLAALVLFLVVSHSAWWLALALLLGCPLLLGTAWLAFARTELWCNGRSLSWQQRLGPLKGPLQRISLLDLHWIGAVEGRLLLEPRLGPLQPISLDARGMDREMVEQIAGHLRKAIVHAERFRGDAPDWATHAVRGLLERE